MPRPTALLPLRNWTPTRRLRERGIQVRVIAEPRQGLTYARIAGVKGTRAHVVCFLDDDNLPDYDFVANGIGVFRQQALGLAISSVRPSWEVFPPPSVERRRNLLAVNDYLGDKISDFGATATTAPTIGAGNAGFGAVHLFRPCHATIRSCFCPIAWAVGLLLAVISNSGFWWVEQVTTESMFQLCG